MDGRTESTVKWFDGKKGYGFINHPEEGGDLFVHHSDIDVVGFRTLKEEQRVSFQIEQTPKGLAAVDARLVADDVVALDLRDPKKPLVQPGISQVKLWPDAASAVGTDQAALSKFHSRSEKRVWGNQLGFLQEPVAVRQIYMLDWGKIYAAKTLALKSAFSEIVQHVYAPRFIGSDGTTPACFRACASLVNTVPISRLRRPLSFEELSQMLDLITSRGCVESEKQRPRIGLSIEDKLYSV